jgi:exonuclease SbcD
MHALIDIEGLGFKRRNNMRFFHLSDLHIGRHLHHYSLLEDQRHILKEVINYVEDIHPDAVVISGDIYDKSVPSAEAVTVFDDFLTELAAIKGDVTVMIISGNHDSAQRLDYASRLLGQQNIFIAGELPQNESEFLKKVVLYDQFGEVNFYLLPFLKPGYVRQLFGENAPLNYSEAVEQVLARERIDFNKRNVLLSHQFYTGRGLLPDICDSEMLSVGGIDNVDIYPLLEFDYTALGHLHGAQRVGTEYIRYCGTLLKYSVSEAMHTKSLHLVEINEKGTDVQIKQLPLHPIRDVRRVRGELAEILEQADSGNREDYVSVVLTDEIDPYRPKEQLEKKYSNILEIRMDNTRTRKRLNEFEEKVEFMDPQTVFEEFYQEVQGRKISTAEQRILAQVLDKVKGV